MTFLARCLRLRDRAAQFSMSIRTCDARLPQHSVPCSSVLAQRISDRRSTRSERQGVSRCTAAHLDVDALRCVLPHCAVHVMHTIYAIMYTRHPRHVARAASGRPDAVEHRDTPRASMSTARVWLYSTGVDFFSSSHPVGDIWMTETAAMPTDPERRLASTLLD